MILAKEAKHLFVPQFEDLDKEDMLLFAADYPAVMQALPLVVHEQEKLHRAYIANVIYTLIGEPFRKWVADIMDKRTKKIQEDQNMLVEMDAQVLQAFNASKSVSGKYHKLPSHRCFRFSG